MAAALPLGWRHFEPLDTLGAAGRDFPRGRISEVIGARSSGRTRVLHALLAASTGQGEFAALVDTRAAFDACSAAAAGVELSKLVWIRCSGNAEHALRAADLLIQAGGFGVVALDLAERAPADALERGETARAGLGASLLALGATRLAAGQVDDLAGLVPEYVTLPRGVTTQSGEVSWSRDPR